MADLIIPERYRESHRIGLRRYLRSRKGEALGRRIEVSGIRKNGEEFPVEVSISPIQADEHVLFVGCLRDLTEHHALRLARAEVARVMQKMAMGEMTASIVHEIKQPLAAIASNASAGLRWLASATPNLDEARAALNRIVNDSHRASEVIGAMRSMFKSEVRAEVPEDVNKLIHDVLTLVSSDIESQQISVRTELADKLPRIPANLAQLRQVLVNLIINAVEAMSAVVNRPKVLQVKTAVHDSRHVCIAVEDSGMGIDSKNVSRIFDPFFTTKPDGMGLGLSICRSIVENYGGRLSASRAQPYGSVFHIFLPIESPAQK
jgi:signal transduction histidine kinase